MRETTDRFSGAIWFNRALQTQVLVGGAGGISSWLTLATARAGVKTVVYDDDVVEAHNLAGQFYTVKNIGEYKTEALFNNVEPFVNKGLVQTRTSRYTSNTSLTTQIMMCGFDNMEARKIFFEKWFHNKRGNDGLFIDGRLTAEQLQIFCIGSNKTADAVKYREKYLFDDSQVEELTCTFKQTSHMAMMIASLMTGFLTNHLSNIELNKDSEEWVDYMEVPFHYEYILPINRVTMIAAEYIEPPIVIPSPTPIIVEADSNSMTDVIESIPIPMRDQVIEIMQNQIASAYTTPMPAISRNLDQTFPSPTLMENIIA